MVVRIKAGKTMVPVKKSETAKEIRYTVCPFINFLLVQKTIRTVTLESVVATAKTPHTTKKTMSFGQLQKHVLLKELHAIF